MRYTERYEQLKKLCNENTEKVIVPDSGVEICFYAFDSPDAASGPDFMALSEMRKSIPITSADMEVPQNQRFSYPVFFPNQRDRFSRAIVLLHGLNERKWDKYLSWAHYLAEATGKPVIVFPISFHISRSVPEWLDPRVITGRMQARIERLHGETNGSTFINHTISERLTEAPQRFFLSGLQTANDLVYLLRILDQGIHPRFEAGTRTDLFAYSIGGLLAQVLYMADPGKYLSRSKLFLFCAGSVFGHMNGVSKVILDEAANNRLHHYFRYEFEEEIKKPGIMQEFFHRSSLGMAFRSMLIPERFRKHREKAFRDSSDRVYALAFKNDRVIPPMRINEALFSGVKKAERKMEIHDFNYPYSHEVPFPVKYSECREQVDEAFEKVFRKASVFLS
jgi:pimeloyl-ACP methyl ester carboxylesterase